MNKPKVKKWLHLVGLVIVLAAAGYVVARQGISLTEKVGAFGVLAAALLTALGKIIPTVDKAIDALPDDESAKLPPPSSSPPVVAIVALGAALLLASPVRAEAPQALGCIDTANAYCVVPAAAVGWQINLKTGGAANAVSLVGLTLQHTFGSLPVGLGLYAGLGASAANRGSYQGCLGASITSWGLLCGGVQRIAGEPVWQGMVTFAPQLTFGGTPSYVAAKGGGQ